MKHKNTIALLAAALIVAGCGGAEPAQDTEDSAEEPQQSAAPAPEEPAERVAGGNCNVESGEPGPGEGVYVERDGDLVCESQEGENDPAAPPEQQPTNSAGGGGDDAQAADDTDFEPS